MSNNAVINISENQNLNVSNDTRSSSQETETVCESIRFFGNFISVWFSVLVIIASIIFYIVDVGTDLKLAYDYYFKGDYVYFAFTLSFVIIPYLISLIVSGIVYRRKILSSSKSWQRFAWSLYVLTLPISRYISAIRSGCKKTSYNEAVKKNKKTGSWYEREYFYFVQKEARKDMTEANFLRLFECFMESGPQLLLQLYILLTNARQDDFRYEVYWFQYVSITLSVISLTWTWTNYQHDHFRREKIFVMFIHLFALVARVLILSLFTSVFQWWILLLFCFAHIAVMKTAQQWPIHEELLNPYATDTNLSKIEKFFMRYVLSAVAQLFIFFFYRDDLLLKDSNEELKMRYFLYYKIWFVENGLLIGMWWYNALYCENELYTHSNRWMVGVVVSSIVAISVFINLFLSGAFYFTTWKIIKKHRDLMKLCRSEKLTNADLERLIQLVGDKVVDVNRRMKYDYAGLDLKTLGTGGAVTALELLFISNKSNDLTNCVESILNAEPAFSLKNICNAITVLTNNTDVLNRDVILQKLMEAKRTQLSTSSNREYRVS